MKSLVCPELPTAALRSSQATTAAVDNSALFVKRPQSTYKSGKVVQTNGATSNYVFYSKRTGLLSMSTITSGFINVGLLLLLISHMDLKGAAIAFAISMAIKFLLTWYVAQLRHPIPWLNFRSTV